ncbi:MAG: pSer/pThr/pTyr-binding forkhead associated (FHA) protein [Bradymonadia bacterium]|jgi:pSer/pThr/pTyr-binding forkhead associated (FHA) protein
MFMSANPTSIDDIILEALEQDDDFVGHARGADAVRPSYFLQELHVPSGPQPIAREAQGYVSAAQVEDLAQQRLGAATQDPVPALTIACPGCTAENEVTNKFCGDCGTAMQQLPRPQSAQQARVASPMAVSLVSINEDGSDGPRIALEFADSVLGRAGDIRFPTDAFLSPKHARFSVEGTQMYIEDLYSLNGTYVKLREETRLTPGDTFLMGRQVLRFEKFENTVAPKARSSDGTRYMGSPPPGGQFKLLQVGIGGVIQNIFCLHESGAIIGREKGDVIFPRDKFMSGRHAQIFPRDDGHYYLVDLNSSNGTWIKIWERRALSSGDFVFLGQQLFRVEVA